VEAVVAAAQFSSNARGGGRRIENAGVGRQRGRRRRGRARSLALDGSGRAILIDGVGVAEGALFGLAAATVQ